MLRQLRLQNQHISANSLTTPEHLVSYMVAMQSQVYSMAKWAIGLRLPNCTEKEVDHAFDAGRILRTHVLRPTWHFVSPSDIRWLLKLTGPRVQAFNSTYYVKHEVDNKLFKKSNDVLIKMLRDRKHLTRNALQAALEKSKIKATGIRLAFIMMQAELDGIVCSGARDGKQFTYALIDERVPPAKEINREESLFLLAQKYFRTRGPATANDFAWWSGLTVKDCKDAITMLGKEVTSATINKKEFYYMPAEIAKSKIEQRTFYMPDYDEYGIAYKDRSGIFGEKVSEKSHASLGYPHVLVVDGVIAGTWKIDKSERNVKVLDTKVSRELLEKHGSAIKKAGTRFRAFTDYNI